MSTAEIVRRAVAEAMKMVAAGQPAPVVQATPDVREKRLKALEKARAAKAAKASSPKPAPVKAAKPAAAPTADRETFTGHGKSIEGFAGVNKRGRKYAGIRVSDAYGRSIVLNKEEFIRLASVLRSEACRDVQAFIELHSN